MSKVKNEGQHRKQLQTWSGRKNFQYEGSVSTGTEFFCGKDFRHRYSFTADEYRRILDRFSGHAVCIGTSRTAPPNNSLGQWIKDNFSKTGVTSYIGPILIREGYAEVGDRSDWINFKPKR
jgi:hypothetical protein